MDIQLVKSPIEFSAVERLARETYGDMVKAVADIERGILAIGGDLHADAEDLLLQDGSKQENVWGFNIYPEHKSNDRIEFISLINVRPRQGNRSMTIEHEEVREKIYKIVEQLVQEERHEQ